MKKIEVIGSGSKPVIFSGKNINVINKNNVTLIIREKNEVIAVFNLWNYWRKLE